MEPIILIILFVVGVPLGGFALAAISTPFLKYSINKKTANDWWEETAAARERETKAD